MPSFSTVFTAAAVAGAALVSAAPVVVERYTPPAGWATGYLEPYDTYHVRYLALDCQDQHNTQFFTDCCHPLLASESLSSRPSQCTPSTAQISSAAAVSTATQSAAVAAASSASADEEEEYCDASSSASSAVAAATTTAVADAEANYAHAAKSSSTTSSKAAATSSASSSSSGGSGQTMTGGFATYFYQGGNAGACGTVHSDSDLVIAIDSNGWWSDYLTNDNSQYCGKWITVTNSNNGKSVTAMVADVCPTCATSNSLDLSVGAFTAIASESDGMVPITWKWA